MDWQGILQTVGVVTALFAFFSNARARDNERAATLAEIKSDIKHIQRRLDALERSRGSSGDREGGRRASA